MIGTIFFCVIGLSMGETPLECGEERIFSSMKGLLDLEGSEGAKDLALLLTGGYRGIKAARFYGKGETVLNTPLKHLIYDHTLYNSKYVQAILAEHPEYLENDAYKIEAFSLYLYELGKSNQTTEISQLYMKILPQNFDCIPSMMDDETMQMVQDEALIQNIKREKKKLKDDYHRAKLLLPGLPMTFNEYIWGTLVCVTRTFTINVYREDGSLSPDMRAMVPLADMLNTQYQTNAGWYYDPKTQAHRVFALKDIHAGEEIMITYGSRSNLFTYFIYGFVDLTNPDMELDMEICLNPTDPLYAVKMTFLGNQCQQFKLSNNTNQHQSDHFVLTLARLRFMHLQNEDRYLLSVDQIKKNISENHNVIIYPYSFESESALYRWLIDIFRAKLKSYPTTQEQDLLLMEEETNQPNKNAIMIRYLTKRLYSDLITSLNSALSLFDMNAEQIAAYLDQLDELQRHQITPYLEIIDNLLVVV